MHPPTDAPPTAVAPTAVPSAPFSAANPYASPTTIPRTSAEADPVAPAPAADVPLVRFAGAGLRLIGVFFVVEGTAGVLGSLTNGLLVTFRELQHGYTDGRDPYSWAWFASSAFVLVSGVHLALGGRWVLENVVLPLASLPSRSEEGPSPDDPPPPQREGEVL